MMKAPGMFSLFPQSMNPAVSQTLLLIVMGSNLEIKDEFAESLFTIVEVTQIPREW